MGINLEQYRAGIGSFNNVTIKHHTVSISILFCLASLCLLLFCLKRALSRLSYSRVTDCLRCFYVSYAFIILLKCCDVETNPDPDKCNLRSLTIFHWNLNSISVDNFVKLSCLEAYLSLHSFDIICLSETFLNSTFPKDNDRLHLSGYNLLRSDHPFNTKKTGVCIYYKEHLPLIYRPNMTRLQNVLCVN